MIITIKNLPVTAQTQYALIVIFLVGLITSSLIALGVIVGACFAVSYEMAMILNHLSSTQALLMLIVFYLLYRLCRYAFAKVRGVK